MKLPMLTRIAASALLACAASPAIIHAAPPAQTLANRPAAGVVRVHSLYGFDETVDRIKADVAAKGIKFFTEFDQTKLGEGANIKIPQSKLLMFGNPPLGVQFLSANPYAGLDWPVRMLVVADGDGSIWVAWTDFTYIKQRYKLKDRDAAIKMATEVSASIASSVTK